MPKTKTPHCKKLDEYDHDHRYTFEYRNHAVKAWSKGKKRRQRCYRRTAKQQLESDAEITVKREKKYKYGVVTLRQKVQAKKEGRHLIA
jgi:hypothetical protein